MYCVTGCLLHTQFLSTAKDSQFILTVIFIFISKLNHIISKLEMTAALSLSPSLCVNVCVCACVCIQYMIAERPQDSQDCCITS